MNGQILLLTVCLALSTPQRATAATSSTAGSFVIPVEYDKVVQWLDVNRLEVFKAGNCEVLATQKNNRYRVRTNTPLGACTYVVRETVENGQGSRIIRIRYVNNISGRIADQRITLTVLDDKEGTKVRVSIYTVVRGLLIPNSSVKAIQKKSISGIKLSMLKVLVAPTET